MRSFSSNREIISILENLREKKQNYPPELMQARRKIFTEQVMSITLAVDAKESNEANVGNHPPPPSISTIIGSVLLFAIVVEGGIAAYLSRGKFSEFVEGLTSSPDKQIISPIDSSSVPSAIIPDVPDTGELPVTPMPISPPITNIDSPTPVIIIVDTPASVNVENNDIINEGDQQVIVSTPDPKDNNGNHYGQTPKPEQQKETKPKDKSSQASKNK